MTRAVQVALDAVIYVQTIGAFVWLFVVWRSERDRAGRGLSQAILDQVVEHNLALERRIEALESKAKPGPTAASVAVQFGLLGQLSCPECGRIGGHDIDCELRGPGDAVIATDTYADRFLVCSGCQRLFSPLSAHIGAKCPHCGGRIDFDRR